jgi:hypothetical protein
VDFTFPDFVGLALLIAVVSIPIILWKRKKRWAAVILVVVLVPIGIAIVLPSLEHTHVQTYRAVCISNLRALQEAKRKWAEANHGGPGDIPAEDDLYGTNRFLQFKPVCPDGGTYTIGAVNEKPKCSLADKGHKLE